LDALLFALEGLRAGHSSKKRAARGLQFSECEWPTELRSYSRTDAFLCGAFSAYARVIANVAILSVRGRRQCVDARRWNADMAVNISGSGMGARIGFLCGVPLGYVFLASHDGCREHRGGDQSRRQELDCGH
jgi:hypothetical protein